MRVFFGLPAVRILPWHFHFRYSCIVMPVNSIFRATHILMKYEITSRNGTLSNFCTHVSSTFSRQDKYVTVSSSRESIRNSYIENRQVVDSSKSHVHRSTDYKRVAVTLVEEMYSELMIAPKWLTNDEWSAVGLKFCKESFLSSLWPTLLLHFIAQKTEAVPGLHDVGMSLVYYVASLSDRHRLTRLVSAIVICILQGGENHHEKALVLYDELRAEYDVLDHRSASILITALARTRYWRCGMELMDMLKITAEPGSKEYSAIIIAAMVNQDDDLANELLATLSRNDLIPDDEVFLHMLASKTAEQVLTVLMDFAWIPSRAVIDSLIAQLQSHSLGGNLIIRETKMSKNGFCHQCGDVLEHQPRITDEEFVELRQAFMNKSLIRNGDIFLQSSPEELSAFRQFLEQHQSHPFTVVFDGLNIASSVKKFNTLNLRNQKLQEAISVFSRMGHRVLVFGRQHVKTWEVYKHRSSPHTGWFFTQNLTSDDPFMLYAALYFGQETFIVTNDELRDHRHVLGPELASRLELWQRQRQITFTANNFTRKFHFKWPITYNTVVQRSANGWHIPFDNGIQRSSYSLPDAWYCFQSKKSR